MNPTVKQPFLQNCETDLFASRLTTQLKDYNSWRPDTGAIHTDNLAIHWAPLKAHILIGISIFQPHNQNAQGDGRQDRDNSCRSSLASTTLVAGSAETPDIATSTSTEQPNPLIEPVRPQESPTNVSSATLGHISHFYRRFQAVGIPGDVAKLLIVTTRASTQKTYESSWNL